MFSTFSTQSSQANYIAMRSMRTYCVLKILNTVKSSELDNYEVISVLEGTLRLVFLDVAMGGKTPKRESKRRFVMSTIYLDISIFI